MPEEIASLTSPEGGAGAGSGSGDLLDTALPTDDGAETETATDETSATEDGAESTSTADEPTETTPAKEEGSEEGAVEGEAAAEEDPLLEEDGEIKPDKEDGKTLHFRAAKAHKLLKAHSDIRAIQEAIPDATVENLQSHYKTHVVFNEMAEDFSSGEPERVAKFTEFWFGKEVNPESVAAIAAQLPYALSQHHPQALGAIERQVQGALVNRLYRKAQQSGDENDWALAQRLHQAIENKFIPRDEFGKGQVDPGADIARRAQELTKREREYANRQLQDRATTFDKAADSEVEDVIDTLISAISKRQGFEGKPHIKWIKRDLLEKVQEAKAANPDWARHYASQRDSAIRRGSDEAKRSLAVMMRKFAEPVIRRSAKAVIEAATGTVLQQSAEAHKRQTAAQTKRETTAGGAPTSRSRDIAKEVRAGKMTADQALDVLLG